MRSNLKTREDDVTLSDESRSVYDAAYVGQLLSKHVQKSLSETLRVLSRIHENFTADRERELTKVKASATDVFEDAIEARSVYYRMAAAEALGYEIDPERPRPRPPRPTSMPATSICAPAPTPAR